MILENTKQSIKTECQKNHKQESCGLVLLQNEQELVVPCLNAADNPAESFVIDPDEVERTKTTFPIEKDRKDALYHSLLIKKKE